MENPEQIQEMAYWIVKLLFAGAVAFSTRVTYIQIRQLIIEIIAPVLRVMFNKNALLTLAIKRMGLNIDTDKLDQAAEIAAAALVRYVNESKPLAERAYGPNNPNVQP